MTNIIKVAHYYCAAVLLLVIILKTNESESNCCHACFIHPFKWFAKYHIFKSWRPNFWFLLNLGSSFGLSAGLCTLNSCDKETPDDGSMNPCSFFQRYCSDNGSCNIFGCNCETFVGKDANGNNMYEPAECLPYSSCAKEETNVTRTQLEAYRRGKKPETPSGVYNVSGLGTFSMKTINAALRYLSVNSDKDDERLSCKEVDEWEHSHRDEIPHNETKDYACGLKKEDRPEWFRDVDKNNDDTIQLIEFDKDLAEVPNLKELIAHLRINNGLLTFSLDDPLTSPKKLILP